jgi:hypothetical protein
VSGQGLLLDAAQWVTDTRHHNKLSGFVRRDTLNAKLNERSCL